MNNNSDDETQQPSSLATVEPKNSELHVAAGLGDYVRCVLLVEECGADIYAENEMGLRPVDLAINIMEQIFNRDMGPVDEYEKIVIYLGSVEMKRTGRERYLFIRDNYDVARLLPASAAEAAATSAP